MKQRLIDANELRKNLSSRYMNELYPDWRTLPELTRMRIEMLAKEFRFAIDHAPTIDAVSVVRCRECKYAKPLEQGNFVACMMWIRAMHSDGFCYEGRKRGPGHGCFTNDGGATDGSDS